MPMVKPCLTYTFCLSLISYFRQKFSKYQLKVSSKSFDNGSKSILECLPKASSVPKLGAYQSLWRRLWNYYQGKFKRHKSIVGFLHYSSMIFIHSWVSIQGTQLQVLITWEGRAWASISWWKMNHQGDVLVLNKTWSFCIYSMVFSTSSFNAF